MGVMWTSSYVYGTTVYKWGLSRNKLRGLYPTGGRMGMCLSLEKVRTARFSPYNSYSWPNWSDSELPKWSRPTTQFRRFTNYSSIYSSAFTADFSFTGLTYGGSVGFGELDAAKDVYPPAGFSSDLSGVLVYVQACDHPIKEFEVSGSRSSSSIPYNIIFQPKGSKQSDIARRYNIKPAVLNFPLEPGVKESATEVLATNTPSGMFWHETEQYTPPSSTFNIERILPEVETWRELNLYPIGFFDGKLCYISNPPIDYSLIYRNYIDYRVSQLYVNEVSGEDRVVHIFDNLVYWVTREGPISRTTISESEDEKQTDYIVLTLAYEVTDLTMSSGFNRSRYIGDANYFLTATNAIMPRVSLNKSDQNILLEPYRLPLGGPYNEIFSSLYMIQPGAPAVTNALTSPNSEILFSYDLLSVPYMCGNIPMDSNMFVRNSVSSYIHAMLWSEIGRIYISISTIMMPGISGSLIGLMASIGAAAASSGGTHINNNMAVKHGSITSMILSNYTMPEIGVLLGSVKGHHKIHMFECETDMTKYIKDNEDNPDPIPPEMNNLKSTTPKLIYEYDGYGASPHRVTFCDHGVVLIPTDIGILEYDYVTDTVLVEWLNPTLIPYILDYLYIKDPLSIEVTSEVTLESHKGRKYYKPETSSKWTEARSPGRNSLLHVSADIVYDNTEHIGSYGQVTYKDSDFTRDLIVVLDRGD